MTTTKIIKNDYSFSSKWSKAIATHGFTSIPNLLLRNYKSLNITAPELRIIIALELHRWDDNEPWPSINTLAKLTGVTGRRARALVSSLNSKGLVVRTERDNKTNTYNFDRLIYKLDQLATFSQPPGQKEPPSWDETRLERGIKSSSNKDAANQDSNLKPNINTGSESTGDILSRNYLNDP